MRKLLMVKALVLMRFYLQQVVKLTPKGPQCHFEAYFAQERDSQNLLRPHLSCRDRLLGWRSYPT